MSSQDHLIKLVCSKCKSVNYWSKRNKKKNPTKVERNKFCNTCKIKTVHKEGKK